MAKYTELFSEYIEGGGDLPASFSEIYGFSDLFKAYYCDKEIGFETEVLFAIKLEAYARIYIPIYKDRIGDLAQAIVKARTPVKIHYEKTDITFNGGEQNGSSTDLPYNATTSLPNTITHTEDYTNEDERETTREESGLSINEAYFVIDELNKKVNVLVLNLLKEFEHCFMVVY